MAIDNTLLYETIEARRNWLQSIKDIQGKDSRTSLRAHDLVSARWQRYLDLVHTANFDLTSFEDYLKKFDPKEAAFGDDIPMNWEGVSE